jgi:hypothetical protein
MLQLMQKAWAKLPSKYTLNDIEVAITNNNCEKRLLMI